MSRQEFISPEGLRVDGRRPNELRAFAGRMGVLSSGGIDGSASFEMGGSRVLATVSGPREALEKTALAADSDCGFLTVKIHTAAFSSSGGERRARNDKRLQEWARLVEGAFSGSVMADSFPRSAVDIFVEVLNADGGVLATIINAVNLALIDAGIPMRDYVAAVGVAYVQNTALLDPSRTEEGGNQPSMTFAFLPHTHGIVMTTAEPRLSSDKLEPLVKIAAMGADKVFATIDDGVVRKRLSMLHSQSQALHCLQTSKQVNK